MEKTKEKKKKRKLGAGYLLGSAALLAISSTILPKLISSTVDSSYKENVRKKLEKEDDDWGPEIVKK